jgi:hypothetical protein
LVVIQLVLIVFVLLAFILIDNADDICIVSIHID